MPLPKLGLELLATASIFGQGESGDRGEYSYMLDVDEGGILIVGETEPATLDGWRDSYPVCKPRGPVEGKLDDGWTLEFTCPALDPELKGATTYFVHVQRTIAGKHVACGTYGSTPETAATVLKACKTLRPVR